MHSTIFKFLLAGIILFMPAVSSAQVLTNGTMGREFWIAIPPNEKADIQSTILDIYITSNVNTNVTVEIPSLGYTRTKTVTAFTTTTFGQKDGIGNNLEIRDSEVSVPFGIHITSPELISVNVLNAKPVSSEGFTALPLSVWGKENIHCSFYDFGEVKPWGGGFLVVAAYDNTVMNIELRGKGFGRTVGGKKVGDVIQKTLQKGDVFMVRGNGATLNSFDLTGSKITSSRPIGLISFHERTMIPAIENNNGREHIVEMIPPVSAWGRNFVSYEFHRKDKGDFFRAVAKEDGTIVSCTWYDKVTNQKIQNLQWILNAGQFQEFMNSSSSPGGESIRGYAVWASNKPILLMQYGYSGQWDGTNNFDPLMLVVPPIEQYVSKAIIQTPSSSSFTTNNLNFFAIGDSTDSSQKLLRSIKINGTPLFESDPQILLQRISGTNIYYIKKKLTFGVHQLESDTKLGAYMYGSSSFDQYGWFSIMSVNKIDEFDTLAPQIQVTQSCGVFKITAREQHTGISDAMLLKDFSSNFKDNSTTGFANDPKVTKHEFNLEVLDPTKDARAVFEVIDRAGNVVRDTVEYTAEKLTNNIPEINFGKVRVGTTEEFEIVLSNNGTSTIFISAIQTSNPDIFLAENSLKEIQTGGQATVKIRYMPKMETSGESFNEDSLIVITGCGRFKYFMFGRGTMPKIAVGDFNAGLVKINEKVCLEKGLWITNPGTENIIITEISGISAPFTLSNSSALPATIAPGDTLFLKDVCFQAGTSGNFVQQITFKSDAMAGDSISEWRGSTTTTAINDFAVNNNLLKISPNPATNGEISINYSVTKHGLISVQIFDAEGKIVKTLFKEYAETGDFKTVVSASELPAGVYYCRMTIDNILTASQEIVIAK